MAKNEQTRTTFAKNRMLESLKKTMGVVSTACARSGVGRTQFYKWLQEDEKFKEEISHIDDDVLDWVESKAYQLIGRGNESMIRFYLERKGKKRGYGRPFDSQEQVPDSNIKINITGEQ